MEVLGILFWSVIFVCIVAFMFVIKPLADLLFPLPKEHCATKPTWLCKEEDDGY